MKTPVDIADPLLIEAKRFASEKRGAARDRRGRMVGNPRVIYEGRGG